MTVWVFRLRSFSCLRTMSAESWSLKGRTIRTVGFSFGAGIGCGSSTLEAINDLTVEFIRCCGYFSREKTAIRRSHSKVEEWCHDVTETLFFLIANFYLLMLYKAFTFKHFLRYRKITLSSHM